MYTHYMQIWQLLLWQKKNEVSLGELLIPLFKLQDLINKLMTVEEDAIRKGLSLAPPEHYSPNNTIGNITKATY